jgi:hypothetical protein
MSRIDVNLPLQIVVVDVAVGRKAGLQGPPREGPEAAPKPPSQCEREIGFTRQFRESREASYRNDRTPDRIAAGLEGQRP